MQIKNCIPRSKDLVKLEAVIKEINSNKIIVFLGAGVSINKGYRSWEKLIYDRIPKDEKQGLLQFSNIKESTVKKKSYPEIIELCQKKIGNRRYFDFLKDEYARKPSEISDLHILLCKTNFQHFITTNFDPCLYDNAEGLQILNLRSYKHNHLELIKERTIYHIHGRAFLKRNEKSEKIDTLLKHLIFSETSFKEEYSKGFEIKSFLYDVLLKYKLLFVGYSMRDPAFNEALGALTDARLKFLKDYAELNSITTSSSTKHSMGYMILEYPVRAYEALKKLDNLSEKERDKFREEIKEFSKKEDELNKLGVDVIGFNSINDKYLGLTIILQYIKTEAALVGLTKPLEEPDPSINLSLTGDYNEIL